MYIFLIFFLVSVTTSDAGWTDATICKYWFERVFIPHAIARRVTPEEQILLVFDGHATHETPEMKELAFKNNILLYCLPPKTTHKLQPLDVGVFGPLQTAWNKCCQECTVDRNCVTQDTVRATL